MKRFLGFYMPAWLLLVLAPCPSRGAGSIELSTAPSWGTAGNATGRVHNTTLGDHGVAVYIFVEEAGGWWNKPYAASPVTSLQPDSSFSALVTTGGLDPYATRIIAFLVPLYWSPPILSGSELPANLLAYPHDILCRPHGDRVIQWSGLEWTVKRSVGTPPLPMGPGPNLFSDNDTMVWTDGWNRLHMRVARHGAEWQCTELIGSFSPGYSRYQFDIVSRYDLFDPRVIAGMFTWDDGAQYADDADPYFREIDLEFSRWGDPSAPDAQYVVQPWQPSGHVKRFHTGLSGDVHSLHWFDWTPDSISFGSRWGDSSFSWNYRKPLRVPVPGREQVRINLHLYNGTGPSSGNGAELILGSFTTGVSEPVEPPGDIRVYPNPVREECTIRVHDRTTGNTLVEILDARGIRVEQLWSGVNMPAGTALSWTPRDRLGSRIPAGIYLLRVRDDRSACCRKIVVL